MASKASIANLALHRLGINQLIANVDTESTQAALSIKAVFDNDRDAVLRDFSWPWATTYMQLGLVAGTSAVHVNDDWIYSYRYPPDSIFARRMVTADGIQPAVPPAFRVGRDAQGRLIYTNVKPAVLEYTGRVTAVEEFDAIFVSMLAWRIAGTIAPSLTRVVALTKHAHEMYLEERSRAESGAANEGQKPKPNAADWTQDRA